MTRWIGPLATTALVVSLAGCAHRNAGLAREIQPSKEGYAVKNDEVALEFDNQNFQDALVVIDLPEGQTVRLGWVPGQHKKAWAVPLEVPGVVTFHIQLQKPTANDAQLVQGRFSRGIAQCQSQMYFNPGTARSLNIRDETGGNENFCPGMSGGPI